MKKLLENKNDRLARFQNADGISGLKQSILILSFSPLDRDPRVQRQIRFLQEDYQITAAGFSDPSIKGIAFIQLPATNGLISQKGLQAFRLKSGRFESYYWHIASIREARTRLAGKDWCLILANDLHSLPLALELAKPCGARVLMDAHEYEPRHFDDSWHFNFFFKTYWEYVARKYLPQVDAMTTVCAGIAKEYKKNFGVECEVITNASDHFQFEPTEVLPDRIRMIHHGICNPSRRIENMIELMKLLDKRFTLDMMLVPDNRRYFKKLVRRMNEVPSIKIRDPVPMHSIVPTLNDYDLGLYLLSPKAFNSRMSLPNKLFEFIQARLGVVIWPSPEMAKIVHQYDIGLVSNSFSVNSAAQTLNSVSISNICAFKNKSHTAASILCAQKNREKMLGIVLRLIGE